MHEGETRFCALSWTEELRRPAHGRARPRTIWSAPRHFWRAWLADGTFPDHPWRVLPAALGARAQGPDVHADRRAGRRAHHLAARDAAAASATGTTATAGCATRRSRCGALHALGLDWEADDFMQFVADLERNEDGSLQIMYGIERRERPERARRSTTSRATRARGPVRVGNGAYNQRQNDVYGAVLDSVYLHTKQPRPHPRAPVAGARRPGRVRRARSGSEPDQGIWEARGEPQHYVSSKLMCWVALDRGARLAETARRDRAGRRAGRRSPTRSSADILEHGVDERGVFRQHYDTDALDASTLLVPLVRFLPADDERVRATVMAIARRAHRARPRAALPRRRDRRRPARARRARS